MPIRSEMSIIFSIIEHQCSDNPTNLTMPVSSRETLPKSARSHRIPGTGVALMLITGLAAQGQETPAAVDLAAQFAAPPMATRPNVWWHWMGSDFSETGITETDGGKQLTLALPAIAGGKLGRGIAVWAVPVKPGLSVKDLVDVTAKTDATGSKFNRH